MVRQLRRWLLCGLLMVSHGGMAADLVTTIFSRLPASDSVVQPFTEIRHIAFLEVPLISHGTFRYEAPSTLVRRVNNTDETFTITKDQAKITEADGVTRQVSLDAAPELRLFSVLIRGLLSADRALLAGDFTLTASGTIDQWQLELTPRHENRIQQIEIVGSGGVPSQVTLIESGAEKTIIDLASTAVGVNP